MDDRKDLDIELETTKEENEHIEDTDLAEEEEFSAQKLKKLKDKLKNCEQERMSAIDDLQRARADFLNARKRLDEEKVQSRERDRLQFIEDILPLCDSFTSALNDKAFQDLPDNLKKGVLGINMQLTSILKSYKVEEFGEIGEEFDPKLHEALADNAEGNTVSEVIQKGYRTGENVIRPAKVIVG